MHESKWVEVGDVLITKTYLGETRYPITRITKTLAKSKRERDGFEYTFKREISYNMSHPYSPYCAVEYTVEKNK